MRVAEIPPSLVSKVIDDTLETWARQADERKGALRYNIPVFSKNILRRDLIEAEDYITGIDILRAQVRRIIANIDEIATLPGAEDIRIGDGRTALSEIRVNLEDVLRFQIQPLVGMIRMTGLSRNPESLGRYIDDQLWCQSQIEQLAGQQKNCSENPSAAGPPAASRTGLPLPPALTGRN